MYWSFVLSGVICSEVQKGQKYNEAEKEILTHALITNVDYEEVLAK